MAELIYKKSALNALSDASYGNFNYVTARNAIDCIRTTTEAEIRAKAQREIVEWCFDNKVDFRILERYADKEGVVDCVLKHFTAEQMKEEQ